MEISYRREMKRNYLVVELENKKEAGYEARMLAGNHIQGLLQMRIKYQEGMPLYYYDISSRQPLNRLLETRFITRDEICLLLIQLHSTITRMEEYLLREDGILLEPEYIYVEPELFHAGLCLVPEGEGDFQESLNRLLQYLLKRVNHKDRECVVLAYGLYQESLKENFSMEDLLRLTAAEGKRGPGSHGKPQAEGEVRATEGCEKKGLRDALVSDNGMSLQPLFGDISEAKPEAKSEAKSEVKLQVKPALEAPDACSKVRRLPLRKLWTLWLCVVLFPPTFLWGFKGMGTVIALRYIFLWIDVGLLALLIFGNILMMKFGSGDKKMPPHVGERQEEKTDPWRILYEDDDEAPEAPSVSRAVNAPSVVNTSELNQEAGEGFQTVLLSDVSSNEDIRILTSLQPQGENIPIPYYPFVIGKHRELADFTLSKDTVSRFHLRIDKEEERFLVTDLNSTNGTRINSHLLEANETVEISPGDKIYIADMGYLFS